MRRRLAWLALLAFPLLVLACQLLAGIEERTVFDGGPGDATPNDAPPDSSADSALHDAPEAGDAGPDRTGCDAALPPSPPDADTAFDANVTFYSMLHAITFADDAGNLGFDLDKNCTCEGVPKGLPSCASPMQQCDKPGGRDIAGNVTLNLLDMILGASGVGSINDQLGSGQLGLIIEVFDFNTGSDDTSVGLTAMVSSGTVGPDGGYQPAMWNGKDTWSIDPRSVLQTDSGRVVPKFVTTSAYVTNGTLVARLPSVELGIGGVTVMIDDAVVVARILGDTLGGFSLDGQLAGRIPATSIFAAVGAFRDPADKAQYLCGDDPTFLAYKPSICNAVDIMADPARDNTGAACDAISMSVGFRADFALLGPVRPGLTPTLGCDGSVATCP